MNARFALEWFLLAAALAVPVFGDDISPAELARRQCRSVHLAYPRVPSASFYNEVTVRESAVGTYFCVIGFNHGYFGIQEREKDKVVIFSVWDPGKQDDPNQVASEERVKILHRGDGVRAGRFGNEGTGGQSFFEYKWKVGETCRFLVDAAVSGSNTTYAAWFYRNDLKEWKHLVTMQTITGGDPLNGGYAFIEDFQRDYKSAQITRRADFGPTWVKPLGQDWQPVTQARFTADPTPSLNVNATAAAHLFTLATGGSVTNQNLIGTQLALPDPHPPRPPRLPPVEQKRP